MRIKHLFKCAQTKMGLFLRSTWAGAVVLYIGILFFKGYAYGVSDQIDLLSYVQYLNNKSLYSSDFFISQIIDHVPNERSFLAIILSWAGDYLAWVVFLLHSGCAILLFVALFRIANRYIQQKPFIWLALVIQFVPMSFFTLGGNELYYAIFINSNPSKMCGAWAIYFFLSRCYRPYTVAVILATLFHPMAGFQVFVLTISVFWMTAYTNSSPIKWPEYKEMGYSTLVYGGTAGVYLSMIFMNYVSNSIPGNQLYEMINFRIPHHFIPSRFGLVNYVVLVPLAVVAGRFYRKKDPLMYYFFLSVMIPAIVYVIGVEWWHCTALFTTQWFKTFIWIKPFSIFAVVAFLEGTVPNLILNLFQRWIKPVAFSGTIILIIVMLRFPEGLVGRRVYHFPGTHYATTDDAINIALEVRKRVPKEALFIQPAEFSALKFFGARSSYVDVKAVVHNPKSLLEWYQRVQDIYALTASNLAPNKTVFQQADEHFFALKTENTKRFRSFGITHILTRKSHQLNFPIVVQNKSYIVYDCSR